MKKYLIFKNLFPIALILILVFLIWGRTLNQGLWGDGFYFFNPSLRSPASHNFWSYNSMALLLWNLFIPIFRDNQKLYLFAQLLFFSTLVLLLYFIITKVTKNYKIALIASILFLSNYGGIYEMLAEGNVNRFLDRVPNLIISFLAVLFLIRFLKNKQIDSLITSFLIFAIGIFLGHFSSFLMPFLVVFSIVSMFNRKKVVSSVAKGLAISSMFAAITFLIVTNSDQKSGYSLLYYLNPSERFLEKALYFSTPLFVPKELVLFLANHWPNTHSVNPYIEVVAPLTLILIVLSLLLAKFIYKKNKNLFKVYVSSVLAIIPTNFLMIYTDPIKYNPFKYYQAGRDVFIQSIYYAVILAIIIYFLSKKFTKNSLLIICLFLSTFVVYNTFHSWKDINDTQYLYVGNKKYFAYIKSLYPKFDTKTNLVVGTKLESPNNFINDFYQPPVINIISSPEDIARMGDIKRHDTYIVDIDYNPTEDGFYKPENVRLIDLTTCYKSFKFNLNDWGTKNIKYYESLCNQE